jgi:hypothetical protein
MPSSRGFFDCTGATKCPPPKWVKVEASSGQTLFIDIQSIERVSEIPVPPSVEDFYRKFGRPPKSNVVRALIYTDDGLPISQTNAGWYDFDCDRPYMSGPQGSRSSHTDFLPPKSIGYQLRTIACGGQY